MCSSSDRFCTLILGSSHIKRLHRFRAADKGRRHFGFARPDLQTVICNGVGGLKLPYFLSEFSEIIENVGPACVFIQIGGNDLCARNVNLDKFVKDLLGMCKSIQRLYGVKFVVIGAIPYRNVSLCSRRWPIRSDFNIIDDNVNRLISRWCEQNPDENIKLWQHRELSNSRW